MTSTATAIKEELRGIVLFIGTLWGVFLLDLLVFPVEFNAWVGLRPRTLVGALGIPLMPFLHASLGHLAGNTVPLFVLLLLLAGSRDRSWHVVTLIVLLGGVILWGFGRNASHVGASALVFGLITFLIFTGFLERRPIPLLVSFLVGFLYGGTLLWGILPFGSAAISWDGHLCGAIAGALTAFFLLRQSRVRRARPVRPG